MIETALLVGLIVPTWLGLVAINYKMGKLETTINIMCKNIETKMKFKK